MVFVEILLEGCQIMFQKVSLLQGGCQKCCGCSMVVRVLFCQGVLEVG